RESSRATLRPIGRCGDVGQPSNGCWFVRGGQSLRLALAKRADSMPSITMRPIGVLRTPFPDRVSTPRQPYVAKDAPGTIELLPGHDFEHALEDLDGWDHIWVLFW